MRFEQCKCGNEMETGKRICVKCGDLEMLNRGQLPCGHLVKYRESAAYNGCLACEESAWRWDKDAGYIVREESIDP